MRWLRPLALAVAFALLPRPALAQGSPADLQRAKTLFRAGASAYKAGNFPAAVQAFDQAHGLDPKPAIRFSAAQALRRWYAVSEDPAHLVKALNYYREYLAEVKTGGRVLDASRAKNEIEVLLAQLGVTPDGETAEPGEVPRRVPARRGTLMIDGPELAAAITTIDGKPVQGWPVFAELPPGRYQVRVVAPGYQPFERAANTVAGQLTPIEVELAELPAQVSIASDADAEIIVDGRPMGRLPLRDPLALPSGSHRLVLGRSGHQVYARDLTLERGQQLAIEAPLDMTAQRITAWTIFGVSAAGAGAGVVLSVLAVRARSQASDIRDLAEGQGRALSVMEAQSYNDALQEQDDYTQAAGAVFSLTAVSTGVGLLLYLLDDPDLYEASAGPDLAVTPAPRDLDNRASGAMVTLGGRF